MEQSRTFINVTPCRAKVRHQQTRRKVPPGAVKTGGGGGGKQTPTEKEKEKQKQKKKSSSSSSSSSSNLVQLPKVSKDRRQQQQQQQQQQPTPTPTPTSVSGDDVDEEFGVEEVVRSDPAPTFLVRTGNDDHHCGTVAGSEYTVSSLYSQRDGEKATTIHDLFSAVGNLEMPYYTNTYQAKPSAVPQVLNYYLHVAGPTAMWRPVLIKGDPDSFKRSFFQLSMKEPIVFEAVIAISQAHLELSNKPGSQPSTAVLQHRGKVLKMLRASLMSSSGPNVQDTALMAVFCMLVLDIMYADWTSVKANMQGFRHLVSLRGGIDNLGWSGWFKMCFSWVELRWAGHIARVNSMRSLELPMEEPTYPVHPFNAGTCLSISRLPEGLREAALQRELSNEAIAFLEEVQIWTTGPHKACAEVWTRQPLASFMRDRNDYLKSLRISVRGAEILGRYILRPSERLLCIGVVAYIISVDGSADDGRQLKGLDDHMVGIRALCDEVHFSEYLLWAGMVLAASTDSPMAPLRNHWVLLDRMLELDIRNDYRSWTDVQPMLRKYFWNPFIEAKWEVCWRAAISRKLAAR